MTTLCPYTAPSDIDRHRRDESFRNALVQHGRGCRCEHCTVHEVWRLLSNAAFNLRRAGHECTMVNVEAGYGPAWMGVQP